MICKNCGNSYTGNYCNKCGQSTGVDKIDGKHFLYALSNSILQIDRGMFFTIKELFVRPGKMIQDYLRGKRVCHIRPLSYILLVATIYAIITMLADKNTYLGDALSGITASLAHEGKDPSPLIPILDWMGNNYAYATLLFIPFYSLASYLAFIKSKYNYFEHLILNIYVAAQQTVLFIVFTIISAFVSSEYAFLEIIPLILAGMFAFWAYMQVFDTKSKLSRILLIAWTSVLNLIILGIALILLVTITYKII